MTPKTLFCVAAGCAFTLNVSAMEGDAAPKLPPPSPKLEVTFAKDISPIFEASCVRCHGADHPKARLNLHTLAGTLKGTGRGSVIVPGNSAKSRLIESVAWVARDRDDFMPPPNNKAGIARLTDEQVGLIRAWIDQGAR